ncbi:hypothetical protein [Streptomyces sp. NPDC048428]|uniref:hypothetical protein n=1 Tax=Streptomyces sp. NPDC048428 TaxID=3154503 RepID=UPI00341AB723
MKSITVVPGRPGQVEVLDVPEPGPEQGSLLVEGLLLGICGTDIDIVDKGYGAAPPGQERLGDRGVLLEPVSVVAKAWEQTERTLTRSSWKPKVALVTGAGPIGLFAAMLGVQRGLEVHVPDLNDSGPKPELRAVP